MNLSLKAKRKNLIISQNLRLIKTNRREGTLPKAKTNFKNITPGPFLVYSAKHFEKPGYLGSWTFNKIFANEAGRPPTGTVKEIL